LAAFALAILGHVSAGAAQTLPSIDARTWRPSTDAEASLVLEPPVTPGPWRWNVGAWADYAHDPVVWRDAPGGPIEPLRNSIGAEIVGGLGIGERAAVGVNVPFFLWQEGASSLPVGVVTGGAVPKAGIGDVTISGKATIISNDRQSVRAGPALAAVQRVVPLAAVALSQSINLQDDWQFKPGILVASGSRTHSLTNNASLISLEGSRRVSLAKLDDGFSIYHALIVAPEATNCGRSSSSHPSLVRWSLVLACRSLVPAPMWSA